MPRPICKAPATKPCKFGKDSTCRMHDVHIMRWQELLANEFLRKVILAKVLRVTKNRKKPYRELVTGVEE